MLISQQDEFLVGRGPDAAILRTYNSLAEMADGDNGDQWQQSTMRRVFGLTGTLNTAGSTISRQGGDGSVIVHAWNAAQAAYVATDGDGAHDRLVKSGANWIWTDGSSQMTETYWASVGDPAVYRIVEQRDSEGYRLSFAYVAGTDRLDRVTTHNHGTGNASTGIAEQSYVQYVWSGNNIIQIVTGYTDYGDTATLADDVNKLLTRTRYAYDGQNRLIQVTVDLSPGDNSIGDGRTYVTTYAYDGSSKRVASITQSDGSSLAITYDGSGRVATLTQAVAAGDNRVTTLAYGANYANVTGPDGQVTRLDYDAAKQLTKITAPPAHAGATAQTFQFGYDGSGNVASVTDSAGKVTSYTHDARGNVLTSTDPNGSVVTRTYGTKNELLTETRTGSDASGAAVSHTTRYAYSATNRLRYVVSAEGRVTEYRYTNGEVSRVVEYPEHGYSIGSGALSEATMNSWRDGLADISSTKVQIIAHDARGNRYHHSSFGIMTTAGASTAEGYSKTYTSYDQSGRLLSRYNQDESAETFVYDGLGRLVASTDLAGGTTTVVFNDAALTTTVILGTGKITTSVFNKAGDLVSEIESQAFIDGATQTFPASSIIGNWTLGNVTASAADPIDGQSALRYTVAGPANGQSQQAKAPSSISVAAKDVITATITLMATTSSSSAAFNLYGNVTGEGYGDVDLGHGRIISGPGQISRAWNSEGFFYITGLSQTEPTVIEVQRRFTEAQVATVRLYPDYPNGSILGNAIIASAPGVVKSSASEAAYLYDKNGRLRVATDATGNKSYYLYDKAGRKVADINHLGHVTEYRYDTAGRVAASVNYANAVAAGHLTTLGNPNNTLEMATIRPAAHAVRRQNIWRRSLRKLAECGPRSGVDIKRRACGA
ncbi:MAG: hypothetical protein CVT74_10295, partial [Alphaproteobacteria bacterium HGW-Alphaproteobacteria-13]